MYCLKRICASFVLLLALFAAPLAVLANDYPSEDAALKGLISSFTSAWHQGDAHALSMFWLADGDFINPSGQMLHGRKEIEAFYAGAFARGYAGSTATASIDKVRLVRSDLAVVDGTFEITGAVTPDHQAIPPESGRYTVVAEKRDGKWWIIANREMEPPELANAKTQ